MLHCLRPPSAASHNIHSSPSLQGTRTPADGTPVSSSQQSPIVNLTDEYTFAVQTSSYSEIKIHLENSSYQEIGVEQLDDHTEEQILAHVLHPNRECVEEALQYARSSTLTNLVSEYFEQSEHTSRLCLLLHHSVRRARCLYAPLHDLLAVLPLDSESDFLTSSQCGRVFNVFLEFDQLENPFPHPESHNFHNMRCCFSELKQQLDYRLDKSRFRIRLLRYATTGSAACLIGTAVGVTISAVVIASHALVALVACPLLPAFLPSKIKKKELSHLAQLDAARRGTYVLHNDLDTIDRLVARLHTEVEGDKLLIRLGLERGKDKHSIQEVAKQLQKNYVNFQNQLTDLEEHLCLCFAAINRARSLLLQEISLHQTDGS